MLHRRALLGLLGTMAAASGARAEPTAELALRALAEGGVVAMLRHARAPGNGDPPGFRLGDCATQRNLGELGRRDAASLGERLRRAGVTIAEVRSSRWCRALDTARLAFPDVPTSPDPILDSFFDDRSTGPAQTAEARRLVAAWQGRHGVLALVTHQVNMTALMGIVPTEGEIVVLRPAADGFAVAGRLGA